MFTGIIQEIGTIIQTQSIKDNYGTKSGINICVQTTSEFLKDVDIGDSIAIQGACMTVINKNTNSFNVDISQHSLDMITLFNNEDIKHVNLEKAMQTHSFFGGHIVSGHVDCIAIINKLEQINESWILQTDIDNDNKHHINIGKYMAKKGSVTLGGVSLTINNVYDIKNIEQNTTRIECNLIPHTIANTTFKYMNKGDKINLEIDMLARYISRMQEFNS
jgi:riboflavin synthase